MKRRIPIILAVALIMFLALVFAWKNAWQVPGSESGADVREADGGSAADMRRFSDDFSGERTLEEAGDIADSGDPDWWLSSGAFFYEADGAGRTIRGRLEAGSKWQSLYAKNNPGETDGGEHPQNIFRLVTRTRWQDYSQQVYGKCVEYYRSADEHRSASNGILLFNRYRDENNLYYTGIRVDGTAIIKKKVDGVYYTMASERIFTGDYDRESNPNLLPVGAWIGLRAIVIDGEDGTVDIKLFIDKDRSGKWELALEASDDGESYGGDAIHDEGYAGIRTDFMDAEFDDYEIAEKK